MTNKTITLDRELVSRIVGLRPDYTCAQLDADEELVRAALADPVPPAGVEPEVLARVCKGHVLGWGLTGYLSVEIGTELVDRAHVTQLQAEVERLTAQKADAVAIVDETDDGLFIEIIYGEDGSPLRRGDKLYTAPSDRSYVSRLAYDALQSELAACQQQLTKARELLRSARASVATHNTSNWSSRLLQGIDAYLSNQSAPADKGGDS